MYTQTEVSSPNESVNFYLLSQGQADDKEAYQLKAKHLQVEARKQLAEDKRVLLLILELFFCGQEHDLKGKNTFHRGDALLIRKTKTLIEVYLDENNHQRAMQGVKVFYAEKMADTWIINCFRKGLWVKKLEEIVADYQTKCTGSINDTNYFFS